MLERKITVLMASFLGQYNGCHPDRESTFIRAIASYRDNVYPYKELIIVSDGCERTAELYENHFKADKSIRLVKIDKQPLFSGNVRQAGLEVADGKIICYLDTDDTIGKTHLSAINAGFPTDNTEWVYYNDYIYRNGKMAAMKTVLLEHGSIGASSIAHLNLPDITWKNCDGYGHDYRMIKANLLLRPYKKIYGCDYRIHHLPNIIAT